MSKAVAEAQGWPYRNHEQFLQVVNGVANLLQRSLRPWRKSATDLRSFYYWRKEAGCGGYQGELAGCGGIDWGVGGVAG